MMRCASCLATRIGAHRLETQVGIAVGNAFADDCVPKQHAGLSTLPCVVHDLLPQLAGRDLLAYHRLIAVDWELLSVGLVVYGSLHECVVNAHADIGTGDFSLCHLSIDESLRVGMLDAHAEHERTTPAVLSHLTCGVAVALHEWHQAGRGQCGVVDGAAFRANLTHVMAYTATTLHQLHLLLVDFHNSTIAVSIAIKTDDKAVAQ